jgi:hypothetical protein
MKAGMEAPLDAVSFPRQLPVRGLCMKELSLAVRERRERRLLEQGAVVRSRF